jgi:hypothetical protein
VTDVEVPEFTATLADSQARFAHRVSL